MNFIEMLFFLSLGSYFLNTFQLWKFQMSKLSCQMSYKISDVKMSRIKCQIKICFAKAFLAKTSRQLINQFISAS